MRARQNLPGFTLIELLVVLAIVSTVIALLLPVLTAARDQATALRCANNVREIALAMSMYERQYHSYPIASDPGYGRTRSILEPNWMWDKTWAHALAEGGFLGGVDLAAHHFGPLVCPAVDDADFEPDFVGIGPHYAYNYFVFPPLEDVRRSPHLLPISFHGRRARMRRDSTRMVLLTEVWSMDSLWDERGLRKWRARHGSHIVSNLGWDYAGGTEVDLRHRRGQAVNVAFFAGNVELVRPRPRPYVPRDLYEDHPFAGARFISLE